MQIPYSSDPDFFYFTQLGTTDHFFFVQYTVYNSALYTFNDVTSAVDSDPDRVEPVSFCWIGWSGSVSIPNIFNKLVTLWQKVL